MLAYGLMADDHEEWLRDDRSCFLTVVRSAAMHEFIQNGKKWQVSC